MEASVIDVAVAACGAARDRAAAAWEALTDDWPGEVRRRAAGRARRRRTPAAGHGSGSSTTLGGAVVRLSWPAPLAPGGIVLGEGRDGEPVVTVGRMEVNGTLDGPRWVTGPWPAGQAWTPEEAGPGV